MEHSLTYKRYQRQIQLKGFGEAGQQRLSTSSVLVVGAGGLGCPALLYLAAAGVGTIGIIDDDSVSLTNLHRQPLYKESDIGRPKVEVAARYLRDLNPSVVVKTFRERLSSHNSCHIFPFFDLIIDGSDNFATRYLVNDTCVLLGKAFVYGAVSQFEGQVAIFNQVCNEKAGANYRDLFPEPPKEDEVLNCAQAGVIGTLPGLIGTMQAAEAIKMLSGIGKPLYNTVYTFNMLTNRSYEISVQPQADTRKLIPANQQELESINYEWLCAPRKSYLEVDSITFNAMLNEANTFVIDVRGFDESPQVTEFDHRRIPLDRLSIDLIPDEVDTVLVFCQSGKRSLQAAAAIAGWPGKSRKVFSLKGGIVTWMNEQKTTSDE